jgi:hypothetical protein
MPVEYFQLSSATHYPHYRFRVGRILFWKIRFQFYALDSYYLSALYSPHSAFLSYYFYRHILSSDYECLVAFPALVFLLKRIVDVRKQRCRASDPLQNTLEIVLGKDISDSHQTISLIINHSINGYMMEYIIMLAPIEFAMRATIRAFE